MDKTRWTLGFVAAAVRSRRELSAAEATAAAEAMWTGASMLRPSDAAALYLTMATPEISASAVPLDRESTSGIGADDMFGGIQTLTACTDLWNKVRASRLTNEEHAKALAAFRAKMTRLREEERQRKLVQVRLTVEAVRSLPPSSEPLATPLRTLDAGAGDASHRGESGFAIDPARVEK